MAVDGKDDDASLELSIETMRAMSDATLVRVLEHLERVNQQPCKGDTEVDDLCRSMREPAPEEGSPLEPLLDDYFDRWLPHSLAANAPSYLAYIPGGGVFPAALADLIANTTNRYTGVRFAAPALVQLEANVLEWFREWMQFPETARGIFTTGGSRATFNGILCARQRHLGADIRPGVAYASSQAHHSVAKSARLAGIMEDRLRAIPVDANYRLRVPDLEAAIAEDRARGLVPFLVVSNAGTTNTGAVDPLDAIADVTAREGLWHHVDGAYGAFFHACPELRPLLAGLPRADSLTLDPHKGLFLPYGTGALLVRDGTALRAVHSAAAEYFPDQGRGDLYDPSQYGPDLTRGFPGFRVWLTVKTFGAARLRAAIAEKRALAVAAAQQLSALPWIRMVAPPQLSLFAFHLSWPGATLEQENAATKELLKRVADRGRVLLTGCLTGGRFLARVCILSFRTRQERVDACVDDLCTQSQIILASRR